jgi:hypothetical protein
MPAPSNKDMDEQFHKQMISNHPGHHSTGMNGLFDVSSLIYPMKIREKRSLPTD